ncbi:MAG: SufD family Fe-S cluster assembly protein [Lactobacillales bacterium]|jgi:Fe-S cluster assembly protein SufD|nr:SufD family Fe-S cluster assembly protein [Lactobacillales bacterium]
MKKTFIQEKIKHASLLQEEPSWLLDLRLQALSELLKFDSFQKEESDFFDEGSNASVLKEVNPSPRIMQLGTRNLYEQLPIKLMDQGVIFTNFQEAVKKHEALIKEYWQAKSELLADNQKLAELIAFANSGIFLYVPKNVEITLPMEYFWVKPENSSIPVYSSILILVEEGASVNYVERIQSVENSGDQAISLNLLVEVIAKRGAKVNFWSNETLDQKVKAHIWHVGKLHRDSQVHWQINALNSGDVILEVDVDLVGEGAYSTVNMAAISSGQQEQKIQTRIKNSANYSKGKIVQHGVALDASKLSFTGIGEIQIGAKEAISDQESRILMLSNEACGRIDPLLLIDENEVSAGHAASIGYVDEEAIYYLMSRGIDKEKAMNLLVRGFLGSVMPAFSGDLLKSECIEAIKRKLNV